MKKSKNTKPLMERIQSTSGWFMAKDIGAKKAELDELFAAGVLDSARGLSNKSKCFKLKEEHRKAT